MTVWLLVAMFAAGEPNHYEVYAQHEACEFQAARLSKNPQTIAYCTKRLVVAAESRNSG